MKNLKILPLFLLFASVNTLAQESFQTKVGLDSYYFFEEADLPEESDSSVSLSIEPTYKYSWDFGKKVFNSKVFYRADANDPERSHFDIRELSWAQQIGNFEYKVGISKEFWGVVESYRLIDVINQADFAEDIFYKERLGQPMVKLSYMSDYGTFSGWVLPYFRERTFTSNRSRLFLGNVDVDEDSPIYTDSDEDKHVDFALRYSKTFDEVDFGLSYFQGTNRNPDLIYDNSTGKLRPFYDQVKIASTDIQWTGEALLLKLEALYRDLEQEDETFAAVYGFEYTFFGLFGGHDLGLLVEHLYDDRGGQYTSFENDIFVGMRYTLNDVDASEFLIGSIIDLDDQSQAFRLEASTRITEHFKVYLESQIFMDIAPNDLFFAGIKDDDYLKFRMEYFF